MAKGAGKRECGGFHFGDHDVTVVIEGKPYKVEQGDAELSDRLLSVQGIADGIDYERLAADGELYRTLSGKVRGVIRAFLGDEAYEEVLGSRPANVIDELELLAYIYEEVQRQTDTARMDDLLARFEASKTR